MKSSFMLFYIIINLVILSLMMAGYGMPKAVKFLPAAQHRVVSAQHEVVFL
jgi:hypothetical protein